MRLRGIAAVLVLVLGWCASGRAQQTTPTIRTVTLRAGQVGPPWQLSGTGYDQHSLVWFTTGTVSAGACKLRKAETSSMVSPSDVISAQTVTSSGGPTTPVTSVATWVQIYCSTAIAGSGSVSFVYIPSYSIANTIRITSSTGATLAPITDPCDGQAKTQAPSVRVAGTTAVLLVAAAVGKKTYICTISVHTNATEVFSILDGTQSTNPCDSGTPVALAGSTTAANGISMAALGEWTLGDGKSSVLQNTATNRQICIITEGMDPTIVSYNYVQE